ncbi:MAG: hypothetical protein IKA63_02460 [Clostridia bacterium]|nr:hypothetical protein [Clostridia bacterium]
MKKIVSIAIGLLLLLSISVSAQTLDELYEEQLEASGGKELLEALPPETQDLLDRLGISSLSPEGFSKQEPQAILQELWSLMVKVGGTPLRSGAVVFGIVLLHAWVSGLNQTLGGQKNTALFSVISALAACGVVIVPISQCIAQVGEATESLSVFMISFVPVYAGILLTGGHTVSALSFQSLVLYAAQLLSLLSDSVIVPLMSISLAIGLIGAVTPGIQMGNIGSMIGKTATWVLTLGTALFSGLLSLQNLAGSAVDTLGNRALKFSIASFVPLVGGSLSEAFSTIRSCLGVLRSTIGVFGIGACAIIVLPPLLSCFIWNLCLSLCRMSAEMFSLDALTSLLKATQSVIKCLIAILLAGAMFAIVAVTVVTMTAGSV